VHEEVRNLRNIEGDRAEGAVALRPGWLLSSVVFSRFWSNIGSLM
jgi:hypothetical protein